MTFRTRLATTARWTVRMLAAIGLALLLAAAGVWWWAGQEGSLEWTLRQASRSVPLQAEGVQGSVRSGWRIRKLSWERDGLRVEADDVTLEWQPLAVLGKTLRVDEVKVRAVRVIDHREKSKEPFRLPDNLGLPWRVTVDEVAVGSLQMRGNMQLDAGPLAGRYAFDGLRHKLALDSLRFADGDYKGTATLQALAPHALELKLQAALSGQVPGAGQKIPLDVSLEAAGNIKDFEAHARMRVRDSGRSGAAGKPDNSSGTLPSATATARITPFEAMPVPSARADFRSLDTHQFWPAAPRTLLSGRASVVPQGTATWNVEADIRNGAAGRWDEGRLPVEHAQVKGSWRDGAALVESLRAEIGGGRVEGEGAWKGPGWRFDGKVSNLDPARLHSQLAAAPLNGPVEVQGDPKAIRFDADLRASPGARTSSDVMEVREIVARGQWAEDTLSLARLRLRTADALVEGEGDVKPKARTGGGKLLLQAPGLQGQVNGTLSQSRGTGTLQLQAADLAQVQRWLLRWPGASKVLPDVPVRGRADAQVAWQGGWNDPTVQARLFASDFSWGVPEPAGVAGATPTVPPWIVRTAEAKLEGRLRDAVLQVNAQAARGQRQVDLTASGRAGQQGAAWQGAIARLELHARDPAITDGAWDLLLRREVPWRFAGDSIEIAAGEALLHAPTLRSGAAAADATLTWSPVRREGGVLSTAGKLSGLPLAWVELFGGPQLAGSALSGDMVFDAAWNAQLGRSVTLEASLARARGDVMVLTENAEGAAQRVPAGVKEAKLNVRSQGDQLVAELVWDTERAGQARGQIRTTLARTDDGGWTWPENAPLAGTVKAQLPRIGVWSVLAPPGWRLRGSLEADVAVAGTRSDPRLTGPITADDLALRSVVDGIELRNGRLRAQLEGQRLVVSEFLLRGAEAEKGDGGGGTLAAHGEAQWTPQGPLLRVDAQLSQLRASIRDDRQLTISGPMAARMDRGGTSITGNLTVDRARIEIPDETAPRLGSDVVVHNAPGVAATKEERAVRPPPASSGRTVTLTVSMDLGKDFRVSGRGIDTRLAGKVSMEGRSLAVPSLTGIINTEGGTYRGYGQRMNIERGEIRFTGAANNPALDILAIRPNLDHRVGVQITGRALAPHVELYAEPPLPEAETLSWLVLGRSSAGDGAESALLQRAAAALLAGRGGRGDGVVGRLGLDDLSVRSDGDAGAVVRVGKRFADNFYAAYERSLSGAMGTLYIFYDITKRTQLRAETGKRTGMDLIFTFYLDKGR